MASQLRHFAIQPTHGPGRKRSVCRIKALLNTTTPASRRRSERPLAAGGWRLATNRRSNARYVFRSYRGRALSCCCRRAVCRRLVRERSHGRRLKRTIQKPHPNARWAESILTHRFSTADAIRWTAQLARNAHKTSLYTFLSGHPEKVASTSNSSPKIASVRQPTQPVEHI